MKTRSCVWTLCLAAGLASGQTASARGDRRSVQTVDGKKLEGRVLNETSLDLQLRLALNRSTGDLAWETTMADWRQNYNATSAPLTVGNLVITGTAGGEQGARGFVAAYDQASGKEVWRFWTVPAAGEPGSETWKGKGIEHPSAVAWFTGTYDPELGLVYWPTGNPGPDYNDAEREGDNLYSCSILALDAKTGKLQWHYQFTPHDVFDWDATEPPVLADMDWQGQPRKVLLQANRNGFFYVLDRTNGKLLLAKPFIQKITWAKEIGANGRPVLNPLPVTSDGLTRVCPAQAGGANWYSMAWDASSGLYFLQTVEHCGLSSKQAIEWEAGKGYMGGFQQTAPEDPPQKGRGNTWGGMLATASGLVFFCEDGGGFVAVDSSNGKPVWRSQTNQRWNASSMACPFDGQQYVSVAAGGNILAFALGE